MQPINVKEKLSTFEDYWNPRIIGRLNGQLVKVAKFQGEFVWHKHDQEDELFKVIKGEMQIEFRDRTVTIKEGEFIVVPRGVEHKPSAAEECEVLLFEPDTTINTGGEVSDLTQNDLEEI